MTSSIVHYYNTHVLKASECVHVGIYVCDSNNLKELTLHCFLERKVVNNFFKCVMLKLLCTFNILGVCEIVMLLKLHFIIAMFIQLVVCFTFSI